LGKLTYGPEPTTLVVDDRTLWHLKIVILDKLRRNESHTLTWTTSHGDAESMDCIWLNPATSLHFVFDDSAEIPLNWVWIEALARAANSPIGLRLLPEAPAKPTPRSAHAESTGVL
jgi:hypothetical protein